MVPPDRGVADHHAPLFRDSLDAKELRYRQVLKHLHGDLRGQVSEDVESRFGILLQEANLVGDVAGQTRWKPRSARKPSGTCTWAHRRE